MKTIQEVLRELKVDEIEKCYFDEHPIELLSLKGVDAFAIGKYRKKVSSAFQSFVGKLRNMEIVDNSDDPWILFVCKSTCENRLNGHTVELIHLKELMKEKDLSKVLAGCLDLFPWTNPGFTFFLIFYYQAINLPHR